MPDTKKQNDSVDEHEVLETAENVEDYSIIEDDGNSISIDNDLSKVPKINLPKYPVLQIDIPTISVPKIVLPKYNFTPLLDNYCKSLSNLCIISDTISSRLKSILPSYSILKTPVTSVSRIIENYADSFRSIRSPFLSILDSFDTSYISQSLKRIASIISERLDADRIKKYLVTVMAESRWFPYAGWIDDLSIFYEISDIVASSRGISARRTKRIDAVILNYYNKEKIKDIKTKWRNSYLPFHIRKILGQALEAHLRGEYALTITCLATMWEGLILDKLHIVGRQRMSKTRQDFAELIEENDFLPVFSEFYNDYIVSDCSSEEDVIEGIPNRNGVSHSKYKKYPNKKASLNAILLTDFIIHLEPKQQMEEENGQA